MLIPTSSKLLEKIRSGRETVSLWQLAPDAVPRVGDVVTFQEATFDKFHRPVGYVENGASVTVLLTKVVKPMPENEGAATKRGSIVEPRLDEYTLIELEWEPPTKP
jgi:hypothetical protein